MKKHFPYFCMFFCSFLATCGVYAQKDRSTQTLWGANRQQGSTLPGFFLAPGLNLSAIDNSTAVMFNLRGGITLADRLSIGGFFQESLNEIYPVSETKEGVYLDYWAVGGFVEGTLLSHKVFHLTFPLHIGYGEVEMDNDRGSAGLGEANFLQIEPGAMIEVNLHDYVRLNLGGGYRFVQRMSYRNMDQSDLSGLSGYIGLKIGLFR